MEDIRLIRIIMWVLCEETIIKYQPNSNRKKYKIRLNACEYGKNIVKYVSDAHFCCESFFSISGLSFPQFGGSRRSFWRLILVVWRLRRTLKPILEEIVSRKGRFSVPKWPFVAPSAPKSSPRTPQGRPKGAPRGPKMEQKSFENVTLYKKRENLNYFTEAPHIIFLKQFPTLVHK